MSISVRLLKADLTFWQLVKYMCDDRRVQKLETFIFVVSLHSIISLSAWFISFFFEFLKRQRDRKEGKNREQRALLTISSLSALRMCERKQGEQNENFHENFVVE